MEARSPYLMRSGASLRVDACLAISDLAVSGGHSAPSPATRHWAIRELAQSGTYERHAKGPETISQAGQSELTVGKSGDAVEVRQRRVLCPQSGSDMQFDYIVIGAGSAGRSPGRAAVLR